LFTTIVDDVFAFEFDQSSEFRMLTVQGCWKWAHRLAS